MPFELGIDIGCRDFHPNKKYRMKSFLILEEEQYSTQKALSDISFGDCKCHFGDGERLVFTIREWLMQQGLKDLIPATKIWDNFNFFVANLVNIKSSKGYTQKDIDNLPIPEYINFVKEYKLS